MRWVGIDEAGYGPNLGPMVLTAVVAEGPDETRPDLWRDLSATVCRAGDRDRSGRLWVDDSKAILRRGAGRDRLEAAALETLAAARGAPPRTFDALLAALDAGTLAEVELSPWLDDEAPELLLPSRRGGAELVIPPSPFAGAPWKIVSVRSVVVGPARFNAGLAAGGSKARVHFAAFTRLLLPLWEAALDGVPTAVRSDKHGGRHFYLGPLVGAFPDARIDRGEEGPDLSRYLMHSPGRRLELSLLPRADADDGLVALASVVSKTVRELWMDAFNAHWLARVPGLRPTAGYPTDAGRFRRAIEAECRARGLDPCLWWRSK